MKIVDLTHDLHSNIPSWDGDVGFELNTVVDYKDCTPPNLFRTQKINCSLSMGTHMDAPAHVIEGGRTINQLKLEELVVDCVVIDVSSEANENYIIMPENIEKFEKNYGKIKDNTLVVFHTGWSDKWNDRNSYHNNHRFPSVHESAAKILLDRNIAGLGIDTFSADTGLNGFPVHNVILGAGKYLVENLVNAKELPPFGAKIFVMPIKVENGTEAPIRLIALV